MKTTQEVTVGANHAFGRLGCAVILGIVLSHCQPVWAGNSGSINGRGVGWAKVNVTSSTLVSKVLMTYTNLTFPSAAMAPLTGYLTNAPLPSGASPSSYARMKAISGGSWIGTNYVVNGDGADNPELERRIAITPADCAFVSFDTRFDQTQDEFDAKGHSGSISVNAEATGGTALWLRGFEYTGPIENVPVDDPTTVDNETIEWLKTNGVQKFETLLLGPFKYGGPDGATCPLIIPFGLESGNLDNLYLSVDTVAKSLPLVLNCPDNVVVGCGEPVVYGQVSYAGCGDITITYSKKSSDHFDIGVTPVTVTATDDAGNSTNCTFTVTVTDNQAPVIPALPDLTGQCSVTVTNPVATDNCAGSVTGTTTDPLTYNTQGTFTIHWTFGDGNGNTNTATQTVIVQDTVAPVKPTLANATASCGSSVTLTRPTTTDNCAGTVTGTTSDPLTYSGLGTNIVHWTFSDGNGNSTTANQTVIITGLTFSGFYSPISAVGGDCTKTVYTANRGSNIPFKFDVKCGSTLITTGNIPVVIEPCAGGVPLVITNAVYQNDWHYNWDSSAAPKGNYKFSVNLPDGTSQFVFIKLK